MRKVGKFTLEVEVNIKKRLMILAGHQSKLFHRPVALVSAASPQSLLVKTRSAAD